MAMIFRQFTSLPDHPCMNDGSHHRVARIHLPVAPLCNIRCGYCERQIGDGADHAEKPGQCERVLGPEEAVREARDFLDTWGRDSVVGIAGPGDPLANPETFETLALLRKALPDARLCLCTNGLNLPHAVDLLKEYAVAYISVTVNGIDPAITSRIHAWVEDNGRRLTGINGAEHLLAKQREGIEKAFTAGMFVKINTVAIPGINVDHIPDIAKTVAVLGAGVMNVMPLIPGGMFSHLTAPDRETMDRLYQQCNTRINVFTSCKQCRADARGIPGKDRCSWKKTA